MEPFDSLSLISSKIVMSQSYYPVQLKIIKNVLLMQLTIAAFEPSKKHQHLSQLINMLITSPSKIFCLSNFEESCFDFVRIIEKVKPTIFLCLRRSENLCFLVESIILMLIEQTNTLEQWLHLSINIAVNLNSMLN